jgi:hypothetical protein
MMQVLQLLTVAGVGIALAWYGLFQDRRNMLRAIPDNPQFRSLPIIAVITNWLALILPNMCNFEVMNVPLLNGFCLPACSLPPCAPPN